MANQSPLQIEGHRSRPPSPSLSLSVDEGIYTIQQKQDEVISLIVRDDDPLDSDNYESEGVEIEHIYLNDNDNNSNHESDIKINSNPVSPKRRSKNKKKRKHNKGHKRDRKRKNRKRKMNHIDNRKVKKMKREQIQQISLISDDENDGNDGNNSISNISYSVREDLNSKENPIYIDSGSESDDCVYMATKKGGKIYRDFPSPSPIIHNAEEAKSDATDICGLISRININNPQSPSSLALQLSNLRIKMEDNPRNGNDVIQNNNNNNNSRTRRPSPPPQPPLQPRDNNWDGCNLDPLTRRAVDVIIPTKEMKSLVKAINNNSKHLMYTDINSKNRILAIIISILEMMAQQNDNSTKGIPHILLIAPRRHMALQAREILMQVGKFFKINSASLIGGMPTFECIKALQGGVDVITCCPGKLCGLIQKGKINLNNIDAIAFHGADELRSMSDQMHYIADALPQRNYRVIYVDAIVTPRSSQDGKRMIRDFDTSIHTYNDEKKKIKFINEKQIIEAIHKVQHVAQNSPCDKKERLYNMLRYYQGDNIIIYFNQKCVRRCVYNYVKDMDERNNKQFNMLTVDGDFCNQDRINIIGNFRENGGFMFTTDLLNDDYQFKNVIVINYGIPHIGNPCITYIKRINVSSSNTRFVFNLVGPDNKSQVNLDNIAAYYDLKVVSYHEFSRDRRDHVSHRNRSVFE